MKTNRSFLTAAALVAVSLTAHALTLPVSEDTSTTTITKTAKTAGKATTLPVSATRSALVRFEVGSFGGTIPSGNVTSARLILYIGTAKVPGDLTVRAVTSDWSEVFVAPLVVPAIDPGTLAAIPSAQVVAKQFVAVDVTAQVQAWLDTPADDFGFAVTAAGTTNVLLGSKEGSGTGYPAELQIETVVPIADGSIGSAKLGSNLTLGGTTTGTFSGGLTGNVSGSAASFTGSLSGDVTGTQSATVVSAVGSVTAAAVASAANLANGSTSAAAADAIVRRDGNGGFAAGTVTALKLSLPATSASDGQITLDGARWLHSFGTDNFFAGKGAGNFTMNGGNNTGVGTGALAANTNGSDNNAFGHRALASNTTGTGNVAAGSYALELNQGGAENVAIGFSALSANISGGYNTALGSRALASTTDGDYNTAVGYGALNSTHTASFNTAVGYSAMLSNDTGRYNTALGVDALRANVDGRDATALGYGALASATKADFSIAIGSFALNAMTSDGLNNAAVGTNALAQTTSGSFNTALGLSTLYNNTTGNDNVAVGYVALLANGAGTGNTALGIQTLKANTTGNHNVAVGSSALLNNNSGLNNVGVGHDALLNNTTGNSNIAIGLTAGNALTTGSDNIDIGNSGVTGESATIRIGTTGLHSRAFIAGIAGVAVSNSVPVLMDVVSGQLGTISSSRRYKEDIADMGDASARLDSLRPVTFRYKKPLAEGEKPVQFGLIAEEVAEVFPELCVRNAEGQPETVKYQDLAPLLLNEFLKERRHAKEVEATLRGENAELRARLERLERALAK